MPDIFQYLEQLGIRYQRVDHPPVYTVEEARRLVPPLPGAQIKNLFLRDAKGQRHFLVVAPDEKPVDLKALGAAHQLGRLSFASPERLLQMLGLTPGAVSLLALINDSAGRVELILDEELERAERVLCHPLDNRATLSLAMPDVLAFIKATGHAARFLALPERAPQREE